MLEIQLLEKERIWLTGLETQWMAALPEHCGVVKGGNSELIDPERKWKVWSVGDWSYYTTATDFWIFIFG